MEGSGMPAPGITKAEVEQMLTSQKAAIEAEFNCIVDKKIVGLQSGLMQAAATLTPKAEELPKKGIPLNGFLDMARFFSTQASASNRSLALGGIAIIWIFKKPGATLPIEKGLLNTPLLFLALSLAIDLVQYFLGGSGWNAVYEIKYWRWKKEKIKDNEIMDMKATNWLSVPITVLFHLKIIATGIAYYYIITYLWNIL